jgi:hypothetical protein
LGSETRGWPVRAASEDVVAEGVVAAGPATAARIGSGTAAPPSGIHVGAPSSTITSAGAAPSTTQKARGANGGASTCRSPS